MKTDSSINDSNQKRQKYLGDKGLILFIAFLSAFIPLSTDIYLPALPRMVQSFQTSASLVNLTLINFFIFYAFGTILWGPLSDKYGRKPILLIGMIIYAIASILCVFSLNVYQLILFRILQSIGCGAATAVSTAIIKDVFTGRKRLTVLSIVQSMGMLSPIIAPVLGAIILGTLSWRGVFIVLSIIGVVAIIGSIAFEETIEIRYNGSIIESLGRLGVVLRNKAFFSILVTFSLIAIPFMSFLSASSYIYVDGFGLSEKVYSYFFAANAVLTLLGPLLYIKLSKRFKNSLIITTSYIFVAIGGILMCTIGNFSPWVFALSLVPISFFFSLMWPPKTDILLDQVDGDTGSASSLINCGFTLFGSIGMFLISFDFSNRILVMGLMYLIVAIISLVAWLVISKKPYVKLMVHHAEKNV